MILCLDVGNSHIFAGVFSDNKLLLQFRYNSKDLGTSDQLGVFFRQALKENEIDPAAIEQVAIASVVPEFDYSLRSAFIKYFNREPFVIKPGVKTGLKIKVQQPTEVGADRIANAIAVSELYPKQDAIIIDFGTATTFCALTADKAYLGGVIAPGMRISMLALQIHASKLPSVEIIKAKKALGRTTDENIQAGLYYGQLALVKEVTQRLKQEAFKTSKPLVIATGGFSHLFADEGVFDKVESELVLRGLLFALQYNASE